MLSLAGLDFNRCHYSLYDKSTYIDIIGTRYPSLSCCSRYGENRGMERGDHEITQAAHRRRHSKGDEPSKILQAWFSLSCMCGVEYAPGLTLDDERRVGKRAQREVGARQPGCTCTRVDTPHSSEERSVPPRNPGNGSDSICEPSGQEHSSWLVI